MTPLPVQSPPRISPVLFHEVLVKAGSPAQLENLDGSLYRVPISYGLDPAIALAFYHHESSYGTRGLAVQTRSWGNQRRSPSGRGVVREIPGRGPFAHFTSWGDSLHDWCELILGPVYVGAGRTTVEAIVPIYAPSSDNNRPEAYIAAVRRAVEAWLRLSRADGWAAPADPWAAWGTAHPLPPEQRRFAIPQAWLRHGQLGAAVSAELALGPGRAARAFERGVVVWMGGARAEVIT